MAHYRQSIIILLIPLLFISCNENETLKQEITYLQKENDSLNSILDTLKTKFIFDQAFVNNVINDEKPIEEGKEYKGTFYYVAYNLNDKILFKKEENATPDTLSVQGTGYSYKFTAKKGKNNFYFNPLILDKNALEFKNAERFSLITITADAIVE